MKTMTAKYPGTCRLCGEPIAAGHTINYYGRGCVEHAACRQVDDEEAEEYGGEDEAAGLEPGTLASDRRLARQGLTVVRTSSGAVWTQNSRGRCEDAPCCGCCT
jgi:hypothetical protein